MVPENRSRPNGRTIRLMVAKYPARSAEKRPDPVVYLAGGPGDIAPLEVNGLIAADFIRDRDVYVVSQRGTMFSEPALTCAANDDFSRELLGLRFYSEATKRAHLAATEACHRELAATGADLSAYNSTESAADFADLRKVLGFEAWNVYGTSYGSYLAQTLMRDHPRGHPQCVLDSVLPTTTPSRELAERERRLRRYLPGLAAEPACNAAHPRLEETFTGLVDKLEAEPQRQPSRTRPPAKHRSRHRRRSPINWLRNQNYGVPMLQARLVALRARRRPPRRHPGDRPRSGKPRATTSPGCPALGYGLALGVSCRESYPFATPEDLAAAGRKAFPDYPASVTREGIGGWAYFDEDCRDVWKVPAAPEAMHRLSRAASRRSSSPAASIR